VLQFQKYIVQRKARECHSEIERSGSEESHVVSISVRFFAAEFILSEAEGLPRMTFIKLTQTEY